MSGNIATNESTVSGLASVVLNTPDSTYPNGQALSALSTGLAKVTTGTGALSTAAKTTDYPDPAATFVVQTATAKPTNAQVLGSLSSGIVKVTTTTGVLTVSADLATDETAHTVTIPGNGLLVGTGTRVNGYGVSVIDSSFGNMAWGTATVQGQLSYSGSGPVIGSITNHRLGFVTNSSTKMYIPAAGGLVIGAGSADIATTATDGFLYAPSCAGTPTGVPTTQAGTVPVVIDDTNNKVYFRLGGAWKSVTPA